MAVRRASLLGRTSTVLGSLRIDKCTKCMDYEIDLLQDLICASKNNEV